MADSTIHIFATPEHTETILTRDEIARRWCEQHGTSFDDLTIDEILQIRLLPEWQQAGR